MRKNLNFNYVSVTEQIIDDVIEGKELATEYFKENRGRFESWALYPLALVPFRCNDVIEEVKRRYAKISDADMACKSFKKEAKNK